MENQNYLQLNINDIIGLLNSNNWKSNLTRNDIPRLIYMRNFIEDNGGHLDSFHQYLDLIESLVLAINARAQAQAGGKRKTKSKKQKKSKKNKK